MSEQQMTVAEMESRFENEWVLIEDPETNEALAVIRGKVIHHAKDRDDVYRQAVVRRPKRCAILYTGKMPEDTAVVL